MRATYSSIKQDAKAAMSGHIGEVILVGLILPIAFSMIANFFNGIFVFIHWSVPTILTMFTSAITTYITLRMVIKIVRFKSDKIFSNFLGSKEGIISSILYALFFTLLSLGYVIIFWNYFALIWDFIREAPADYWASDPVGLENWINDQVVEAPSYIAIVASIIYSIFLIIISVRLSFTTYIIADSDLSFIEAMKKSLKITKGSWWRIVFFPLSFILWSFAVIFTFGLAAIYVVPYIAISHGALYDQLLRESGEDFEVGIKESVFEETPTKENALDEEEDIFDKNDPFENY